MLWLILVLTSLMAAFAATYAVLGQWSMGWPVATGTVLESSIHSRTVNGRPVRYACLCYEYRVGGRRFTSSRVDFGLARRINEAADALVAQYTAGSQINVRHAPMYPGLSVIHPGVKDPLALALLTLPCVALALSAATILLSPNA